MDCLPGFVDMFMMLGPGIADTCVHGRIQGLHNYYDFSLILCDVRLHWWITVWGPYFCGYLFQGPPLLVCIFICIGYMYSFSSQNVIINSSFLVGPVIRGCFQFSTHISHNSHCHGTLDQCLSTRNGVSFVRPSFGHVITPRHMTPLLRLHALNIGTVRFQPSLGSFFIVLFHFPHIKRYLLSLFAIFSLSITHWFWDGTPIKSNMFDFYRGTR